MSGVGINNNLWNNDNVLLLSLFGYLSYTKYFQIYISNAAKYISYVEYLNLLLSYRNTNKYLKL